MKKEKEFERNKANHHQLEELYDPWLSFPWCIAPCLFWLYRMNIDIMATHLESRLQETANVKFNLTD